VNSDQFDDLLAKLPKVAEVVNGFTSEEVQKQAFQTLIASLGIVHAPKPTPLSEDIAAGADDGTAPKQARKTPRKTKPASSTVPERLQDIDLQTSMEGYLDFHALKKKGDKLLWVLQFAQTAGLPSLSNVEIVFLSDRLGDGIPSTDINGYYKSNLKKGHVNRSLQDKSMRILPAGSTYLAALTNKAD